MAPHPRILRSAIVIGNVDVVDLVAAVVWCMMVVYTWCVVDQALVSNSCW